MRSQGRNRIYGRIPGMPRANAQGWRAAARSCYLPARHSMLRAAPSGLTRLAQWAVRQGKTSTLEARALRIFPKRIRTFGPARRGFAEWEAPTLPAYPAGSDSAYGSLYSLSCHAGAPMPLPVSQESPHPIEAPEELRALRSVRGNNHHFYPV